MLGRNMDIRTDISLSVWISTVIVVLNTRLAASLTIPFDIYPSIADGVFADSEVSSVSSLADCGANCVAVNCGYIGYHESEKTCYVINTLVWSGWTKVDFSVVYYKTEACRSQLPDNTYCYILASGERFSFRVNKTQASHSDSKTNCHGTGDELLKIDTAEKLTIVINILTTFSSEYSGSDYWIDGSNLAEDSVTVIPWTFHDGTLVPITTTFWAPGTPQNQSGHHWFRMEESSGYKWNDMKISRPYGHICQQ